LPNAGSDWNERSTSSIGSTCHQVVGDPVETTLNGSEVSFSDEDVEAWMETAVDSIESGTREDGEEHNPE
jgi:hypothetical protein